jgi:hypothetical protein
MSVHDIVILSVIVGAFSTFGVVLGSLTWYCSDKPKRPMQRHGHREHGYPTGGGLITDDD